MFKICSGGDLMLRACGAAFVDVLVSIKKDFVVAASFYICKASTSCFSLKLTEAYSEYHRNSISSPHCSRTSGGGIIEEITSKSYLRSQALFDITSLKLS